MKDLLYVADSTVPSRSANSLQVMRMCNAFAQAGAAVTLLLPGPRPAVSEDKIWAFYGLSPTFHLHWLPAPTTLRLRSVVYGLVAIPYAHRVAADITYIRNLTLAALLPQIGSVAVAFEAHDNVFARHPRTRPFFLRGVRRGSLRAIISISGELAARYQAAGMPLERILVAHDGTDLPTQPCPDPPAARKTLGFPPDRPLVCYTGHLYEWKGIPELLDCAADLPHVQFVIVGGMEEDLARTRAQVKQRHLSNVRLVGHVPPAHVPRYLCAADVLLIPHTTRSPIANYTSPLKLFEYMAVGHPIVATDFATTREVLRDGHNALLVPPDDGLALAKGIRRLLQDHDLAAQLARHAQRDVNRYTWEARARCILDFLSSLPSQHRGVR